jgi:hypothetical protein
VIRFATHRPAVVWASCVALLLAGAISFTRLPLATRTTVELPRLSAAGRRVAELGEGWLARDEEGSRMVDECHAAYTEAVRGIYEVHKAKFFVRRVSSMRIN